MVGAAIVSAGEKNNRYHLSNDFNPRLIKITVHRCFRRDDAPGSECSTEILERVYPVRSVKQREVNKHIKAHCKKRPYLTC